MHQLVNSVVSSETHTYIQYIVHKYIHISYLNNGIRSLEIKDSRTVTGLIKPNDKITMKSVLL